MRHFVLAAMVLAALCSQARADTITFAGPNGAILPGNPTVEGAFRYDAFSGSLGRTTPTFGNPGPSIDGVSLGGVLQVVRDDILGGLFTFDEVDISQFGLGATEIVFQGFLSGALQASDTFTTSSANDTYTTHSSSNLSGVSIDELRVTLNAANVSQIENIDNLDLTRLVQVEAIPEPATVTLLGIGVAGMVGLHLRRRRKTAA